ncbi:MAG: hypothetical protein ABSC53_09615, partial [Bacteroidota bacterium]
MTPQPPLTSPKESPDISLPTELPPVVINATRILKEMASQLPKSVTGLERQMMISDVMTRTDETNKMKLLALINHFLTRMFTLHASDIDMGGYGSQGYIWYRVYGSKKPDASFGKYSPYEINILI